MSDPNPPAGASETVSISSTTPRTDVTLTAGYRNGPVTYPGARQPAVYTDAGGQASITFTVAAHSAGYPVIVEVNLGSNRDVCETHFTPSS